MKILHIVNVYSDKNNFSAQPFVRAQINSLVAAGLDIDVFNVKGNESKINYFKAIRECSKLLNKSRYDIVHGHYVYSGWIASLQNLAPSVVSFMGSDLNGTYKSNGTISIRGQIDRWLSKYLQRYVDGIIVKSIEMLESVSFTEKTIVLPNGVDFNIFKELPQQVAREKLGLNHEQKLVLFIGDYRSQNKSYPVAKKAVKILRTWDPHYDILLACGFPHEKIPWYMNASDVLALPSIKEGSPNVVKEALACNLPVVATDVGDVKEIIGNISGCAIAKRTPEDFAKAIVEVMSNKKPFRGRKAIEHLRPEKIAVRLLDFYSHVIESCKNRRGS